MWARLGELEKVKYVGILHDVALVLERGVDSDLGVSDEQQPQIVRGVDHEHMTDLPFDAQRCIAPRGGAEMFQARQRGRCPGGCCDVRIGLRQCPYFGTF